jgi:hypothetical protein
MAAMSGPTAPGERRAAENDSPPPARAPFAGELPVAPVDDGEVAAVEVLRRVGWMASGLAVAGAAAFVIAGAPRRPLVLTGGAALSIVALRSLEGVVRRVRAAGPQASPAAATPAGLGLAYPFRLLLLVVLVILLAVGGRDPLALVLGLSAVPVAVLVEAGLQLVAGAPRERESGERGTGGDPDAS